ncbi:MAG: hypothetical protein VZR53_11120 [Prevotella sp.]|nr:hypothetical protein [Prevotella sp.]
MNSVGQGFNEPDPAITEITLTNISGSDKTTYLTSQSVHSFINSLNHMKTAPTTDSITFIRVGTGTTEATEDNYKLENYATGLTCESVVTAIGGNYSKKTYTATFSNTTDADISVTEIGFFTNCYYYTTNQNDNFLLDRIVLDTPITIPAGESKAITYELGF